MKEGTTGTIDAPPPVIADAALARVMEGWQLRGKIAQREGKEGEALHKLSAPFAVTVSSRFAPLKAELPIITATVFGVPAEGRLDYRSGAKIAPD